MDNFLIPATITFETENAWLLEVVDQDTGEILQQYDNRSGKSVDEGWFPKSVVTMKNDGIFDVPKWLMEKKRIDNGKWEGY